MFHMPESRINAASIHLGISLVLFILLAAFVYWLVLPGILFESDGGLLFLVLIGGVDVVLGPLLTLIVYVKEKPSIKMDLSVIAIFQIVAIGFGLNTLIASKPLAIVYGFESYQVVYKDSFDENVKKVNVDEVELLNKIKPGKIGLNMPADKKQMAEMEEGYSLLGQSVYTQTKLYLPYEEMLLRLKMEGQSISSVIEGTDIAAELFAEFEGRSEFRVFKFQSKFTDGFLVVDTESGELAKLIKI